MNPFFTMFCRCGGFCLIWIICLSYGIVSIVFSVAAFKDIENAFKTPGIDDFFLKEVKTLIHIAIYLLYCTSLGAGFLGFTSFIGYDISNPTIAAVQDDLFEDKIYNKWPFLIDLLINAPVLGLSCYGYKKQIVDENYNLSSSPFFKAMIIFSAGRELLIIFRIIIYRNLYKKYKEKFQQAQQSNDDNHSNDGGSAIIKDLFKIEIFIGVFYFIFTIISLVFNVQSKHNVSGDDAHLLLKGIVNCNILILTNSVLVVVILLVWSNCVFVFKERLKHITEIGEIASV
jgi:hypothetical protein